MSWKQSSGAGGGRIHEAVQLGSARFCRSFHCGGRTALLLSQGWMAKAQQWRPSVPNGAGWGVAIPILQHRGAQGAVPITIAAEVPLGSTAIAAGTASPRLWVPARGGTHWELPPRSVLRGSACFHSDPTK